MAKGGNAVRWTPQQLEEFQKNRRVRQMLDNVALAPAPASTQPAKRSKYASEKVEQGGEKFDSKREARRWAHLQQRAAAGDIADLRRQVSYELIPKQRRADGAAERACAYVADFVYTVGGITIVEDAKGMRTRDYVIKRKLMLKVHGITIYEV